MNELYLETKDGRIPIDEMIVAKYNLKKGELSPFNRLPLVDKYGDHTPSISYEAHIKQSFYQMPSRGFHDDGISQMDNGFELSTSEILDIAQGVDSD